MKITVLLENTTCNEALACEHGLSLFIEFDGKRILFDTGATGAFAGNAEKLGIDLATVDFAVLSHGHYDHSGGLLDFFSLNTTAPVYMKREAAGEYFAGISGVAKRFIGVNPAVFSEHGGRVLRIDAEAEPIPGCHILTDIVPVPKFQLKNRFLYARRDGKTAKDDFRHELMLVFEEEDGITAVTGCSHNGVISLVETARSRLPGRPVKAVVGGFHLMGMTPGSMGCSKSYLNRLAKKLVEYGRVHTCHCTGKMAFDLLKERMGGQLTQLQTGMTIEL